MTIKKHKNRSLIIVMGVSGSGKSSLAEAISKKLNAHFIEADDFHSLSSKEKMRKGISINNEERKLWVQRLKLGLTKKTNEHSLCCLAYSGLIRRQRKLISHSTQHCIPIFLQGSEYDIRPRMETRQSHFASPQIISTQISTLEVPRRDEHILTISTSLSRETQLRIAIKHILTLRNINI